MGPSVASARGSTGPVFCLTEKANFFDGASSSLHRAKCVNKDCSCYKGKNGCMNTTEINQSGYAVVRHMKQSEIYYSVH